MVITAQDQRSYIAISVLGNVPCYQVRETLRRIFKRHAYSDTQINRLYRQFKNRERLSTSDQRCNNQRPSTSVNDENLEWLEHLMSIQRNWTVEELAFEMEISVGSVWTLLHENGWRKINARWVPHQLNQQEMDLRIWSARANLICFNRDPRMLGRIIAIDETIWRCFTPFDGDQAHESRMQGEMPPTRVASHRGWSRMLILAVHQDQIIAHEFLEEHETMTAERYIQFLNTTIREYIEYNFSPGEIPIIEHDNARSHTAGATQNFIRSMGWGLTEHPPYS